VYQAECWFISHIYLPASDTATQECRISLDVVRLG
jgi:hypothetical protein